MTCTIIASAVLSLAATAWLAYEIITAPDCWEDQDGFHFGRKDDLGDY